LPSAAGWQVCDLADAKIYAGNGLVKGVVT
jgi:hypothetical protein